MHGLTVSNHQVSTGWEQVAADVFLLGVPDTNGRLPLLILSLDDDRHGETGDLVHFLVDGQTLDDVLEVSRTAILSKNGEGVRIPFHEGLPGVDLLPIFDLQLRSVDHGIPLPLTTLLVDDEDLPRAVHHDEVTFLVFDRGEVDELHYARNLGLERGLFRHPAGRASDVERAHGELGARLTDGLGGNHADRLTEIGKVARREVTAIAPRAHSAQRLAGKHRTNLDALHAGVLNGVGDLLGDLLVGIHDGLTGEAVLDRLERHAAHDAISERLDDFTRFDDRPDIDPVDRLASFLGDDDVLRHVDQTPSEVSRVGGLERRIGQPFPSSVSRDEVLEHGETLAEVAGNGGLDDLARGLRHQTAHSCELPDLLLAAASARVGHHVDRVELALLALLALHLLEHLLRYLVGNVRPNGDDFVVTLTLGDSTFAVLVVDLFHLPECRFHQGVLLARNDEIVDPDRNSAPRSVLEPEALEGVQHLDRFLDSIRQVAEVDQAPQPLLFQEAVDERNLLGQVIVEDGAPDRSVDDIALHFLNFRVDDILFIEGRCQIDDLSAVEQPDGSERLHRASLKRQKNIFRRGEGSAGADSLGLLLGQVVASQNHVLRWDGNRLSVRRRQDVAGGQHQQRRLDLRFGRKRNVDRHLVAVEVRVECGTNQRIDTDRLSFHQHRLECLDT